MVRAVEGRFGKPPQSQNLTVTVCAGSPSGGGTPPPAPSNFHVTGTDKSGVTVSWDKVTGASMYLITIMGGPQKYNHEVTDTEPPYRFGALSKNSTYSFKMRAVANGTPGPYTATISGKTKSR
jgi:hypothetical protein